MLEKRLSSKINYEVLKSLTSPTIPQGSEQTSTPVQPSEAESEEFITVIESGPVIPKRNAVKEEGMRSGRTPRKRYKSESESIESLKSSSSVSVTIDPDTKSIILKPMKVDGERDLPRSASFAVEREPEVVVESGPVVVVESGPPPYATMEEHEDMDDEEEEDEEETGLSASQLLTQFRGEAGDSYEGYY